MNWSPEPEILAAVDAAVPEILASQKPNGQFGTEPWITTDQNVLLALAVAWSREDSTHHHDERVLDAIVRGGYALIEEQDDRGMFIFRKKDHSTWGQIYMPWSYSRWIRAYWLTRDAFDGEARDRWDKGLTFGYTGIAENCLERVHNIPAHHAMGLYFAGLVFERDDWRDQAKDFMKWVADTQNEHGWWPEHDGPVVSYNFVYSDALGTYYSASGDEVGLEALKRAAQFHATFAYPDGSMVETVDGRNPYHAGVRPGNPGFSFTPEGRGFLAQQHAKMIETGQPFTADYAATMLAHCGEGEAVPAVGAAATFDGGMGDLARVRRTRPWFFCVNAFRRDPHDVRWGQDWQNFVSAFHDRTGLVMGGGNTKLQPLWSAFTIGDTSLMRHRPGDDDPQFIVEGVQHVPDRAELLKDELGVRLIYGENVGEVRLVERGENELGLSWSAEYGDRSMEGHLTLIPHPGEPLRLSTGDVIPIGEQPFSWTVPGQAGAIEHHGWRLLMPGGTRLEWPALPHNPYRKGGEAEIEEGRIVIVMPFGGDRDRYEFVLQVT